MPPARKKIAKAAKSVYRAAKKYVPKGTAKKYGERAGASLGGAYGQAALGRAVGRAVGKQFAKITGVGDYALMGGSIMNTRASTPHVSNSNRDVVISRSEYLTDLYSGDLSGSATVFDLTNFFVNPGLDLADGGAFSWLPQVAAGFQQYKFEKLVFEYRSTSGDAVGSTNTTLGQVIMAGNYVSTADNYGSKGEMLDSQFAVSCPPSKSMFFPIECKNSEMNLKYHQVRTGNLKSNQNQDMFDFVNFQVATVGMQAAGINLGELHVHYTCSLSKFQTLEKGELVRTANYRWFGTGGANIVSAYPIGQGGASKTLTASPGNSLNMTFDYAGSGGYSFIEFPETITSGIYLLSFRYYNTSAVAWVPFSYTYTNCATADALFDPDNGTIAQAGSSTLSITTPTTTVFSQWRIIEITGPNAKVGISQSAATLGAAISNFALLITELNYNAYNPGQ